MKKELRLPVLLLGLFLSMYPQGEARQLSLRLHPPSVNFSDADPDLVPVIQAGERVLLELEVGESAAGWQLTVLSLGDLRSDAGVIPIHNVSWRVSPSPPFFSGNLNSVQPQLLGQGYGPVKAEAQIDFFLQNRWEYSPGTYSQILLFTLASP